MQDEAFSDVDWATPCDQCLAPRSIRRDYFRNRDPRDEPSARTARVLEFAGAMRFGRLFRCGVCGRPWYEDFSSMCTSVQKSWIGSLQRWNARPLLPTAEQRAALASIGAVHWPVADAQRRVPCRVHARGRWHDPALCLLQDAPLLLWEEPPPPLAFIDEVERIEPTEFGLRRELRQQGVDAGERAMGWAPHVAYWGTERVELNALVELWGENQRMGVDLTAKPRRGAWDSGAIDPRELSECRLTYVIADAVSGVDP
jgi:hypothetical protein